MTYSGRKIVVTAGEASGDAHGAKLLRALKEYFPEVKFVGLGGQQMIAEGLESLAPLSSINVVGFWEVAKKYRYLSALLKKVEALFDDPDVLAFIPIDYPGFNLRLAPLAKKRNLPVLYYIAPQLWAWGKKRATTLQKYVDELYVVFPFEEDFFTHLSVNATFVGHPLLDGPATAPRAKKIHQTAPCIALLPGSRTQEVQRHSALLAATASLIIKKIPHATFTLAKSPLVDEKSYLPLLRAGLPLTIEEGSATLLPRADLALVKAGTSTLETALANTLMTVFYKTSTLSYHLARSMITLNHISLVNIILGRESVREYIQSSATPESLASDVVALLQNKERAIAQFDDFAEIRSRLGQMSASKTAAAAIAAFLNKRPYRSGT